MLEPTATGDWSTPAGWLPAEGVHVPGYEIIEELGRGGMGVVFKARQVDTKRLVALKLIRDGALAGPVDRTRFRIEAEAASRMRHPNIVEIYDAGEHQGRAYFAMEYVAGGSLAAHLGGQPQPAAPAAELVRTLAQAVEHAHSQQIVHRDLKPANVLIADCGLRIQGARRLNPQSAIPKITDFGLAKRLDSDSTAVTQDGAVVGTASYMAPEQAAGRVGEIGPAVDVYALGAILYELLTGRPPFQADSWSQTLELVLHQEPARPTLLRTDVPVDLETICLKCLEKDPGRRYVSARELAEDLDRFLAGLAVAAVPLSPRQRLARLAALDGYDVIDEIGRGPRSIVYRALSGSLKQPVALKVFAAGICTRDEWDARLRRSADLWAALAHPQIVPVQRAGWWDASPYVAVEHLPQGALTAKLISQPTPSSVGKGSAERVRHALRLVEQLAEIVSYVHRQGVVHGNLKPSNVLFAADGIPRITDFHLTAGLHFSPLPVGGAGPRVKVPTHDDIDSSALRYLPPELIRDASAAPRPYTDIYGMGLILYELLTGRTPFAAATAQETLEQILSQDPVPPSRLNAEVTPKVEALCLRCLHKNPWRRYARVYGLLKSLRWLQDQPLGLPPGKCEPVQPLAGVEDSPGMGSRS